MKQHLPRKWALCIFGITFLSLQSGVVYALPTESCPQQSQDFSSLKPKVLESKTRNPCSSVVPTKVSKFEKSDSCTEIYSIVDRSISQHETQKKTGCTNLQQLVSQAQACSPSGANQVACFEAAAQAYEFAAGLDRSQSSAIQQAVEAIRKAKAASETALSTYSNHQSVMNTAISWSRGQARNGMNTEANGAEAEKKLRQATAILRNELRSGVSGEVNASDGGKATILEYQQAVKDYIRVHQRANAFAEEFISESEKVKKVLSQRISKFDQAAKDARANASKGSTAQDPNAPQEPGGSSISGISMPSMNPPAETPSNESSPAPGIASKQERSSTAPVKLSDSNRSGDGGKKQTGIVNNKRVNRESISFEKSKQLVANGGAKASKSLNRFQAHTKGSVASAGRGSFESKGTALLGILKDQAQESSSEGEVATKNSIEEENQIVDEAGSDESSQNELDSEEAQALDEATAEEDPLADATEESGRDIASDGSETLDESLEIDLSTSLFDRVNRKLFQAYRTGKVIYEK